MVIRLIFLIVLMTPHVAAAALLYVDPGTVESDATWTGTNGQSYTSTATGFPGSGSGYDTIKAAISAMSAGDKIYLRGGTYQEGHIRIPHDKDGTAWTEGNYNYIGSFPGEWAILDGQNGGGSGGDDSTVVGANANSRCVIGFSVSDSSNTYRMAYWKFERLEITGGASSDGLYAAGLQMHIGPIWVRYCYFHDNLSTSNSNNPGGLRAEQLQDSIVEYNYFIDNGASTDLGHNCAHINVFSDYNPDNIAANGFTDPSNRPAMARNVYRYNYIKNGVVGIKHKQDQKLTGNTDTSGHSNTYDTYGDKIHHNIIVDGLNMGMDIRQDFAQVYNNIVDVDAGVLGMGMGETNSSRTLYRTTVYNNTIIAVDRCLWFQHREYSSAWLSDYHAYAYNNILSGCEDQWDASDAAANNEGFATADFDNFIYDRNFHIVPTTDGTYDTDGTYLLSLELTDGNRTRYTESSWESARSGTDLFYNSTTTGLWSSTYIASGSYTIESGDTVADAGIGGSHPYLSGVTLPSYVGAANPSDNSWVAGVQAMDATWFTTQTAGTTPAWTEGLNTPTHTGITISGGTIQ